MKKAGMNSSTLRDKIKKGKRGGIQLDTTKKILQQTRNIEDDFEFLDTIGAGGYGKVYIGRHKITGALRAIKEIKKNKLD